MMSIATSNLFKINTIHKYIEIHCYNGYWNILQSIKYDIHRQPHRR